MPRIIGGLAIVVVIAAAIAYFWYRSQQVDLVLTPSSPPAVAPAPPPAAAPSIAFPLPPPDAAATLPALNESDAELQRGLSGLLDGRALAQQAVFEDFVRRVVATVDNLPRQKLSLRLIPWKTAPGRFLVSPGPEGFTAQVRNGARYAPYIALARSIDTKKAVAFYVRFYPLFQQAYQDLGYPNRYFNDRLLVAIDDLLASPDIKEPQRLVQPKVMYQYADPELEARSAGQKIMMRIGSSNAAVLKEKLREIRAELLRVVDSVGK